MRHGAQGLAIGITGAFAAAAFISTCWRPSVSALPPLRPLSPFRWYLEPDPLVTGLHRRNVLVLLGVTAVALAIAYVAFERRDLSPRQISTTVDICAML